MIASIFGLVLLTAGLLMLLGIGFTMVGADFQATELVRLTEQWPEARPITHLYLDEVLPDRVPCVGPWEQGPHDWRINTMELAQWVGDGSAVAA